MLLLTCLRALRLLSDRRLSDRCYSEKVVIPTKALETLFFRPSHRDRSFPNQGIYCCYCYGQANCRPYALVGVSAIG